MLWIVGMLILAAFALSAPGTLLVRAVSRRAGALDTAPRPGQVKAAARAIPNTGGIAVTWAIVLPLLGALALVWGLGEQGLGDLLAGLLGDGVAVRVSVHAEGVRAKTDLAGLFVACVLVLHAMGLVDDRRPLGPVLKLAVMTAPALAVALLTDTRLLTVLDGPAGGAWASVLITVVWFVAVTNAMNFIDNMDGLSGGVAMIAGACFLAAAAMGGQWFVASVLALLVGACAGFLLWNRPPASIFMGDGGSLVLGFTLAFLTTRTTYTGESPTGEPLAGGWYAVCMPLVVLAVPLYDMASVTLIRLRQGKSPMVGDTQHLSHRLVKRGLSKPAAVVVIWGMTMATGVSGIALGSLDGWQAALVGVQTLVLLGVLAVFEFASSGRAAAHAAGDATGGGGRDA